MSELSEYIESKKLNLPNPPDGFLSVVKCCAECCFFKGGGAISDAQCLKHGFILVNHYDFFCESHTEA